FQDNFAEDGTLAGNARADMAQDVLSWSNPAILPGDSVVVTVDDPDDGLAVDSWSGVGPAVYAYVALHPSGQPGKSGTDLKAPETRVIGDRFPLVDSLMQSGTMWYCFRMDTVFQSTGAFIENRYCFDLNDAVLTPGDSIFYFFGAENMVGERTYWSRGHHGQGTGFTTTELGEILQSPMEFTILPAGGYRRGGDILYVDGSDGLGGPAQLYFDQTFAALGIRHMVDRFDVLGPSSSVDNGLASRVSDVLTQIAGCYQTVVWNTGDLSTGLLGDGTKHRKKSNDYGLLYEFIDQHTNGPGLYLSGDDLCKDWVESDGSNAIALRSDYMNFNLVGGDQVVLGEPVSPTLTSSAESFFSDPSADTLIVYGGCPGINQFDVLLPTGMALTQFAYPNGSGSGVISQSRTNTAGDTARVVLSGFGYEAIHDRLVGFPTARVEHLRDILTWLKNSTPDPTGAGLPPVYVNFLGDAAPNPFNPTTTIKYSISERGRVSLRVYNVAGQLVRTLVDEVQTPREDGFSVEWDGTNNAGENVSSGVYFCRLVTTRFKSTKKLVLLK
ncbi:MAG: T9SS type A sorting domain-containing protein, partial [Candidatus Latescibacterota bacterium]